jgi:hypothetical protein
MERRGWLIVLLSGMRLHIIIYYTLICNYRQVRHAMQCMHERVDGCRLHDLAIISFIKHARGEFPLLLLLPSSCQIYIPLQITYSQVSESPAESVISDRIIYSGIEYIFIVPSIYDLYAA